MLVISIKTELLITNHVVGRVMEQKACEQCGKKDAMPGCGENESIWLCMNCELNSRLMSMKW